MRGAEDPWTPSPNDGVAVDPGVRTRIDVVVVTYNSANEIRNAVLPLTGQEAVRVIVVDNASRDGTLDRIAHLDVTTVARASNDGFATGCNAGWHAGTAPYVCFLNPDATLDAEGLERLAVELDRDASLAVVAPRIEEEDGSLAWSLRRFPRVRSTFARALFLYRLFPLAAWADDIVRDPARYTRNWSPDWVSGACILVRREALEEIGGWDEGFFLYGEDIDFCARLRAAVWGVRFEPSVTARHVGGRSGPRSSLLPVLAESRLRYARKHRSRLSTTGFRLGLALGAATHAIVCRGGRSARRGHLVTLRMMLGIGRQEGRRP